MRPTRFEQSNIDRNSPLRKVGFGMVPRTSAKDGAQAAADDRKRFVGALQQQLRVPLYNMPTINSVRIHYDGPLTDTAIQGSFGATIDPLGANRSSPPPGASSVESTMAEPGKMQLPVLIVGIGWHLEPDMNAFTAYGSAVPTPETGEVKPAVPDVFTTDDLTQGGDPSFLFGQDMAVLEWGWWTERAFYHMARAYNLVWQFGDTTNIIRDSLRYTAYTPSNSQEDSASSSDQDIAFYTRAVNDYYRSIGSSKIFLQPDRLRMGSLGATGSAFRPSRSGEIVPVTYGGGGLRACLRGNPEFRRLAVPFLVKAGVPIGIRADVSNTDDQVKMQQWLSASCLLNGLVPGSFTDDQNIIAGPGEAVPELQLNGTTTNNTSLLSNRVVFKGGGFKITVALKGFELNDAQVDALKDVDLSTVLQQETGLTML